MTTTRHTSVYLYGMTGYGRTKTEAKADAISLISLAMIGTYTPRILRFPLGYMGVITRDPRSGWSYTLLDKDDTSRTCGPQCSGMASADDAERQLRRHVAQLLIFETEDNGLSVILDERERRDHAEYVRWQERYREYKALGYDSNACHRMACEDRAYAVASISSQEIRP